MKNLIVVAGMGVSLLAGAWSAKAADPYPQCTFCSRVWSECVKQYGAEDPICQHKLFVCDQICAREIPVVGTPYALSGGENQALTAKLELAVAAGKRLSGL